MIEINTNIKVAVAGCGSAGRNNIREFLKIDDVEITACCDSEESIAGFTSREFGIPSFYTDVAGMLENEAVDALVIALPDGEHLEAALEALKRGINVFCENPLASNYAEAVEMTRAARESGLVAVMNNRLADMPVVKSSLNYISGGPLGRIKYFEAAFMQNRLEPAVFNDPLEEKSLLRRLSKASGSAGAIGELGTSLFDLAVRICGEPVEVSGMIRNISGVGDIEEYQELDLSSGDTFVCQLRFAEGAAGVIQGSWTAGGPHEQLRFSVYGEEASLCLDTNISENEFTVHSSGGSVSINIEKSAGPGLQEAFISAVKGDDAVISGFDRGLQIQYYIEQSSLSAEGGLRLQFDSENPL